jgi:hypothetical protein
MGLKIMGIIWGVQGICKIKSAIRNDHVAILRGILIIEFNL